MTKAVTPFLISKLFIALRCAFGRKALGFDCQAVFFAKAHYRLHLGRGMVSVKRRLICPAVDKQDGLRIVERLKVFVPCIVRLAAYRGGGAAALHFLGKAARSAVFAGVVQIYSFSCISPER